VYKLLYKLWFSESISWPRQLIDDYVVERC